MVGGVGRQSGFERDIVKKVPASGFAGCYFSVYILKKQKNKQESY